MDEEMLFPVTFLRLTLLEQISSNLSVCVIAVE
jgi:hypothetical protein